MASSSSFASDSQYCPRWKYDVFLSFRGTDTRRTFTGHLYEGLKIRGICTFQDDKRLEEGDSISKELLKAIEESQVAIIVFSKKYATSRWCLNELVKIMECKEQKNGQIVIPVFYDVDPSHVRYQRESFAEAFAEHESRYKDDVEGMQKVQAWRTALTTAADLKGYDIRNEIESEKIQQIVDYIFKFCKSAPFLQDIVGINDHLEKLNSLLQVEINDVRVLGIWGIGGVGKTTIAKALFDTLSYQFKGACFLADVKEIARKNELHSLQNTLLSELLRKKDDSVDNKHDGKSMIRSRLRSMKVLIVLDDIDHSDHLEYLAGDAGWFGNGSRVIVTTRDRHLIDKDDAIYEVPTLLGPEAMQLFNKHAFKKGVPDERFKKLSLEVIDHAKGLPLALKVWGSLLHNKDLTKWRSTVDQIKKNSNSEIVEKLKISYDGLEPEEQKIFLDIACFFRGDERTKVMQILESCGFEAEYGLDVLIDKSLVFICEDEWIEMHDLIEDMGKYIVKMQKDLGKPSRIWNVEDFEDMMVDNTGTMAVEAIWFDYYRKICFSKEAMKNMQRLRILYIHDMISESQSENDGSIECLPNNLCWCRWSGYPWKLLPQNFNPRSLVHLDLKDSSLRHLWNETKQLPSLRRLHLRRSKSLKRTPDFTGMPNLEYLDLSYCESLEEVHHSLRYTRKLIELNLNECVSLERFPYVNVESLESLCLDYCYSLEKFPKFIGRMNPELGITMEYSWISEIPSSCIHQQANLTVLILHRGHALVSLPSSICKLKDLVKLDVSFCSKLESLPEGIGDLEKLEELHASRTLISRPPSSIVRLNKLKLLTFAKEESEDKAYFVFPQVNEGLLALEVLNLRNCNLIDGGLPEDIGSLSSLKELNLSGNNFEHLPRSIAQLGALQSLCLSDCKRLTNADCIAQLGALQYLDLSKCRRLTQLPELPPELDELHAVFHTGVESIHNLVTKKKKSPRMIFTSLSYGVYNESIYNSFVHVLFQNISSLQQDISASDSLSLREFTIEHSGINIPSCFHHRGTGISVSVNLPENWYVRGNFLGFAVCYSGSYIEPKAYLIPLCNRMLWMIQNISLSNNSKRGTESAIHFFFVPLASLWDTSKANGKTPNDYGIIGFTFSGQRKDYGFRLLYKDELELEALLQMSGDNDEPIEHSIVTRRSRYDEASCSSSKKQRSSPD